MKFSKVDAVRIPKGSAMKIRHKGNAIWSAIIPRYVSLGDSIAVGHAINEEWETDYGWDAQYGVDGRTETEIVPDSYTDLIHKELIARTGGRVKVTSFARSGDTVADLMAKLNHDVVKRHIAKADYVTICIGANDVLQPALMHLDEYINTGDLSTIAAIVDANLAVLADDSNANSYMALLNTLKSINPNAKYVFTDIYNPYKYLHLEDGKDGFLKPVLDEVKILEIFGYDARSEILNHEAVRNLFDRTNRLSGWAENYVTQLNTVLRNKVNAFGNANFLVANTKAAFDLVPDRPVEAPKHYNDLVNVEYTRGYDTMQMDWGQLYEGTTASDWWGIAGANGYNVDKTVTAAMPDIIEKVIMPDVDPHPEWYGHYVMKGCFADALGWATTP